MHSSSVPCSWQTLHTASQIVPWTHTTNSPQWWEYPSYLFVLAVPLVLFLSHYSSPLFPGIIPPSKYTFFKSCYQMHSIFIKYTFTWIWSNKTSENNTERHGEYQIQIYIVQTNFCLNISLKLKESRLWKCKCSEHYPFLNIKWYIIWIGLKLSLKDQGISSFKFPPTSPPIIAQFSSLLLLKFFCYSLKFYGCLI